MRFRYIAASPLFLMIFVTMVFGGTFRTAPHFPAGNSPSAIGEGDFNHDGKLDLVVANNGDSSVQIFLGEGKGMFKAQAPIPLDGAPVALAVGDFNRDGILDVVALTQDVFVLLGNGDGTFRFGGIFGAGTVSCGGATTGCLTAADFNRDGKLDLAVAEGPFSTNVNVLLGKGDGSFNLPVPYEVQAGTLAINHGDFNGDGKLDLIVSDVNGSFEVLPGNGKGGFGTPIETTKYASGAPLVIADFNGDGKLDVANGPYVVFGDGKGQFENAKKNSGSENEFTAAGASDLDGDGNIDLVVVGNGSDEITVLLGKGDGTFNAAPVYAIGDGNLRVAIGDFNGDTRPDIAAAESLSNDVSILLSLGSGHFVAAQDFPAGINLLSMVVGDFNRDGKLDLAVSNNIQEINVVFGRGNGTFSAPIQLPGQNGWFLVADEFNQDGASDIASFIPSGSNPPDSIWVTLSNGKGGFKTPQSFFAGPGVAYMTTGDFNGDGKPDLAVSAGKFITVLTGNGDGTFQPPIGTFLGDNVGVLAVADLDGDGKADVLASVSGRVYILLGKGDGTFGKPFALGTEFLSAVSIVVADFNGDGIEDVAIADNYASSVDIFLGTGGAKFRAPNKYPFSSEPVLLLTGDFNLDGKTDIAVSAKGADAFVLQGIGDGRFRSPIQIASSQGGSAIVNGDFNSDGKPDLADLSVEFAEDVTVLLNITKKAP